MNDLIGILLFVLSAAAVAGAVAAGCVAVRARRRSDAVLALAAAGAFLSVDFLFLRAPAAAIAEGGVGTVLSAVLFLTALRRIEREEKR